MESYRDKVARLARERTGEALYNNSPVHASIIIEELLRTADQKVRLVTHALDPQVFNEETVVDAVQDFLSDGEHELEILFEKDPKEAVSTGHPFVQEIVQHNTVSVRRLPKHVAESLSYHFTVADASAFRFEPDKGRWEASAAFGDAEHGSRLDAIFGDLWDVSEPVDLLTLE